MPASTRSVEVLPAPLRPTMPTVSPGPDAQVDARQRLHASRSAHAERRVNSSLSVRRAVAADVERAPGVLQDDLAGRDHSDHRQLALAARERPPARATAATAVTATT